MRAQADPYPNAYCFHGERRIEVRAATVSAGRAGGTPGRIFARQGDGVIVVCGADARRGRNHGLVLEQVRTDDGEVARPHARRSRTSSSGPPTIAVTRPEGSS